MKHCPVCNRKFDADISFCPTDGEVLEDDLGSIVGTVLDGQYQVESMLGKGGMGAVYAARHILLGDRVAIKILPAEMRTNAEWLRRFRREGQAARRFRHPNAVTVYDLRTSADGMIYLVMEYVEGHTLDAELKQKGRFSPAAALAVLEPIMSVLNAAHAMGVVHRDLKPENIMIGKPAANGESTVKLLDLGIAKMREIAGEESGGATALTTAGQVLGTPYYMSPEQWGEIPRDGNSELDGRADLYSLGLVLYEMVSGKRPFSGRTLFELRRDHISVTPPSLFPSVPGVPEGFSRAIAHAVAKDRADRPETGAAMSAELKAALEQAPIVETGATIIGERSPSAPTSAPQDLDTNANRTAETIVAVDSMTPAPHVDAPTPAPSIHKPAATMPTVVSTPIETSPEVVTQAAPLVAPPKRSSLPLILGGVLVLVLVVLGGGFFVLKSLQKPVDTTPATTGKTDSAGGDLAAAPHEITRYWLEVEGEKGVSTTTAGYVVALASGQSFKLHFSPSESGYLYIIGPGEKNVPRVFLSSRPDSKTGLKSNEVRSGLDFSFPDGKNWITLDKNPGSESYTIIFSGEPLSAPAFLAANGVYDLTPDEQTEWNSFRAQYKANTASTDTMGDIASSDSRPFVSVKVPQSKKEGEPVIFDLRVEHK
jgi:serine/threonine protein kinase